jgi:hypothetical protein
MDNKIILELVAKNLEEIKLLVDELRNVGKTDPLLIAIAATKAKTLYQELMLLSQNEPVLFQSDLNVTPDEISDQEEDIPDVIPTDQLIEEEIPPSTEIETSIVEVPESSGNESQVESSKVEIQETPSVETETIIEVPQPIEEQVVTEESKTEPIHSPETIPEVKMEEPEPENHVIKILSDQFINEPSVNERLAASAVHETSVKGLPVTNLMNAIGINDRFLFVRELFANDNTNFEKTVDQLDCLESFLEAIDYLEKNFKWTKNEVSLKFMELLKRRFEK